ncbi:RdgB/HAM1 family non-canonical purine NTP pyrophosphatase [Corallococcus sp. AB030]|uniref:RdgB/HAM1 family non-canonical purine NTP pyrophosphatase n=1 Tax=Corallococcus sp. AB030 TaxID=2316716 RepID=UPI000ED4695E|nr:RdgB/HAM1 family non-canonical purine NTP pyrophosphatase [Corallococcus sp. AB030]RKI07377.1 RdgB/HAM1 family non-canonical purine NTP pyrophosphatase [Corallococcus sp. AB030]
MKPKLLFATGNAGKLRELRALVGDAVEVVSLKDLPPIPEPVEDADTLEGNAVKKAREYSKATGLPALADDSGLFVDALDGQPGVLSARYAPGDDKARYEKLLTELADVPDEKRTASFRCALALVTGRGDEARVEVGRCEGVILRAPKGTNGFGYDPVFQVEGEGGRSMAELAPEEKSRVSHRARAFQLMRRHLLAL